MLRIIFDTSGLPEQSDESRETAMVELESRLIFYAQSNKYEKTLQKPENTRFRDSGQEQKFELLDFWIGFGYKVAWLGTGRSRGVSLPASIDVLYPSRVGHPASPCVNYGLVGTLPC